VCSNRTSLGGSIIETKVPPREVLWMLNNIRLSFFGLLHEVSLESLCSINSNVVICGKKGPEGIQINFRRGVEGQQGGSLYRSVTPFKSEFGTVLWLLVSVLSIQHYSFQYLGTISVELKSLIRRVCRHAKDCL